MPVAAAAFNVPVGLEDLEQAADAAGTHRAAGDIQVLEDHPARDTRRVSGAMQLGPLDRGQHHHRYRSFLGAHRRARTAVPIQGPQIAKCALLGRSAL